MRRRIIEQRLKTLQSSGKKAVAWLIDPDKVKSRESLEIQIKEAIRLDLDFFFIGGSLIQDNTIDSIVGLIKSIHSEIPVLIFPGNAIQFSERADALLFLSLISGRNPELLIGQQVTIAPLLMNSDVEILPTGYLLIDGGVLTSVQYISQTTPLPNDKPSLSVATAFAGHL
jgi:phosphoglycerol geranylgeranyltransferase